MGCSDPATMIASRPDRLLDHAVSQLIDRFQSILCATWPQDARARACDTCPSCDCTTLQGFRGERVLDCTVSV